MTPPEIVRPSPGPEDRAHAFGGRAPLTTARPGGDGALPAIGDGHARQGEGEVCGTAVETAVRTTAVVDPVKGGGPAWPRRRTSATPTTRWPSSRRSPCRAGPGRTTACTGGCGRSRRRTCGTGGARRP